jgi:hypothetical protein
MITKDFLAPLMDAWILNWDRMSDPRRPIPALARELTGTTEFTRLGDRDWLCASTVSTTSQNAIVTVLGNEESSRLRKTLKEKMNESGLVRVTAIVPVDASEYTAYLKELGFRQEGTMRQAILYNDQLTDAHILGFLLTDKRGRRRARKTV